MGVHNASCDAGEEEHDGERCDGYNAGPMDRRAFLISMAAVAMPTWPRPSGLTSETTKPLPTAEWDYTAEDFDAFEARTRSRKDEVA